MKLQLRTFYELVLSSSQIVVMAKHFSGGTLGDIAVDDVSFENCMQPAPPPSCSGGNAFRCDSGHCIDQSMKCDFEPDCCDGSEEKDSTCVNYNRYSNNIVSFMRFKGARSRHFESFLRRKKNFV